MMKNNSAIVQKSFYTRQEENDNNSNSSNSEDSVPAYPISLRLRSIPGPIPVPSSVYTPPTHINTTTNGNAEESSSLEDEIDILPHAYPISTGDHDHFMRTRERENANEVIESLSSIPPPLEENGENDNKEEEKESLENKNSPTNTNKAKALAFTSVIILCVVATIFFVTRNNNKANAESQTEIIMSPESEQETTKNETNNSSTATWDILNTTNFTFEPTLPPSILTEKKENETKKDESTDECFTDPFMIHNIEWQAYENGDDAGIPRTYHICSNTTLRIYNFLPFQFKFDFSSGDHYPLVLFRPNVHVKCGYDGAFSNNCTFSGGLFQVLLHFRSLMVNYALNNTSAENITLEGFRFTEANKGVNISFRSFVSDLTLKNCVFNNNHNMAGSIYLTSAGPDTISSSVNVQNSIFENNTYRVNFYGGGGQTTGYPIILSDVPYTGVIFSFPRNINTTISVEVSNSVFSNNKFLRDLDEQRNLGTSAVINLIPNSKTSLQITDSCFLGNRDYSSSVILVGENDEMSWSDNHFTENIPRESISNTSSCVMNYQDYYDEEGMSVTIASPNEGCVSFTSDIYEEEEEGIYESIHKSNCVTKLT